jgi:hypothetical protein
LSVSSELALIGSLAMPKLITGASNPIWHFTVSSQCYRSLQNGAHLC